VTKQGVAAQVEKAREAQRRMQKVCDRLLRPGVEAFDACAADLGGALECLGSLEMQLRSSASDRSGRQTLAFEIARLGCTVRNAQALLEAAGRFHAGLARLIDTSPEETGTAYTAGGKSRPPISIDRGRVAIHG
jgi:hypothetical protein